MATVNLDSTTIAYQDQGAGPPVILLHGFPVDSRMWAAQLKALSATHRVLTPDFRGFGQSPHAGPFTIESLADDVHAFANAIGVERFVLGGFSMGGYVAFAYLRRHPSNVRGLMLVDTKAGADTPEAKQKRNEMIELATAKGATAVADAMQPKVFAAETLARKPDVVKQFRTMAEGIAPTTLAQALAAMRDRPEQGGMLKSIATPTLIVVGEHDAATPSEVAGLMRQEIPDAELIVVSGAGHFTPIEQPEQVNKAMVDFLASLT